MRGRSSGLRPTNHVQGAFAIPIHSARHVGAASPQRGLSDGIAACCITARCLSWSPRRVARSDCGIQFCCECASAARLDAVLDNASISPGQPRDRRMLRLCVSYARRGFRKLNIAGRCSFWRVHNDGVPGCQDCHVLRLVVTGESLGGSYLQYEFAARHANPVRQPRIR